MERRGVLLVANRPPGPGGCTWLGLGIVFLGASLYGLYGDGSLKPGTTLANGFVGGSIFAIVLGAIILVARRSAARTWRGFAVGPDGAAHATFRAADPGVPESVRYEPIPPSAKGQPGLVVMLMHMQPLVLAHISWHDGSVVRAGVHGPAARMAKLPGGKLAPCESMMARVSGLGSLADALRESCPGVPVTLVVGAPRASRNWKSGLLFGVIGAAVDEAFASHEDRKYRAVLAEALAGDLGRDLDAFCAEHGWTLRKP